jgi:hypothetical protein
MRTMQIQSLALGWHTEKKEHLEIGMGEALPY